MTIHEEGDLLTGLGVDRMKVDSFSIRPYKMTDFAAVRVLFIDDVLAGEPTPPCVVVEHALLQGEVFLLTSHSGQVRGAICLSVRRADNVGLIHWLHARENPDVVAALLAFARNHLKTRKLCAFTAQATRAGVPGLPVAHRPSTARALGASGFAPSAAQCYLLRDLTDLPSGTHGPTVKVTSLSDFPGWRLAVVDVGRRAIASALLSQPDPQSGTATLWHLTVYGAYRGRGIGHNLLMQCLHVAAAARARRTAIYIDPHDEQLARFLSAHDFDLVDNLIVYQRSSG
ncbi:GNAT family N-acetyltransferase [Streptomyces sp. 1222.5]|uniref:GNAT family N-acetyltransferase n=1 Tax=Streptomyces sp. 1222.5 TaxID=1881026 RepID=UPI003EBF4D60